MAGDAERLIDVHAHFVTERYVAAARAAGHQFPDGMPGWPAWDADTHLALLDQCGIGTAILSISSPGTHFGDDAAARALTREVNEFGAATVGAHPGRFGHFASLPLPDVAGALAEARYALDVLGSDGVTVETNSGGVYLGDPRFEPLWHELDERAAAVFVHPTSPPGAEALSQGRPRPVLEFIFDSTRAAADLVFSGVLSRWPRIRWIFTHGGGVLPLLADRLELFRTLLPGVGAADPGQERVQQQLRRLWFDLAGTPFPHQTAALVSAFGSERVLYGSDYCWTPAAAVLAQLATFQTAEQPAGETWRALTTRNAELLFPRLGSTASSPIGGSVG